MTAVLAVFAVVVAMALLAIGTGKAIKLWAEPTEQAPPSPNPDEETDDRRA